MTRKQKKQLTRIFLAAAIYAAALILPLTGAVQVALFLVGYVVARRGHRPQSGQEHLPRTRYSMKTS